MHKPATAQTNNHWIKLTILALFAGGFAAFFVLGGDQYLTLDTIKNNRDALLTFTNENYLLMIAVAIAVYATSTALSIPGGLLLSLTVGFLFGRWVGTAVIIFAATLGATAVFLAARYLFAEAAQKKMGDTAQKIIKGFDDNALHYLLFLRLVPLFPFWLVNLVPAFTPIKIRTYVIGTAIGIMPGCFVFANLGQSLATIDSLNDLLSGEVLIAFGLLGVFSLIPVIVKKIRGNNNAATGSDNNN